MSGTAIWNSLPVEVCQNMNDAVQEETENILCAETLELLWISIIIIKA